MPHLAFQSDPPEVWSLLCGVSGRVAYDIGANGGLVARTLSENFEVVVAFEPCAESFADLASATAEYPNVDIYNLAVSCTDDGVELNVVGATAVSGELVTGDSLAYSWGAALAVRSVPSITIDSFVIDKPSPDFVKIDTEGHEIEVLRGGWMTFEHFAPTLLVEVHAEANGPFITSMLPNYEWRRIDHDGYQPGSYGRANHYYLVGTP